MMPLARSSSRAGTVGEVCFIVCVVSISFAAIAVGGRSDAFAIVAMILVAAVALILGLGVTRFADKHPQAALMEEAEFLKHEQQQVLQSKRTAARVVTPEDKSNKLPRSPERPGPLDDVGEESTDG